jgi:hypothetical protein
MSDVLWLRYWPYQTFLPRHPEPAVQEQHGDEDRIPGLVDESN